MRPPPASCSGVLMRSALTDSTLLVGAAAATAASTYGMGHHLLTADALSAAWACATAAAADAPAAGDVLLGGESRLCRHTGPRSVPVPRSVTLALGGGGGGGGGAGGGGKAGGKAKAGGAVGKASPVASEAAAAYYFLAAGASPAAAAADRVAAAWAFGRAAAAAGADVFVATGAGGTDGLAERVASEYEGAGVTVKGDELVDVVPGADA